MGNAEQKMIMCTVVHGKFHAKRDVDGNRAVYKVGDKPFAVSVNTANNLKDVLKPVSVSAAEHMVVEAAAEAVEEVEATKNNVPKDDILDQSVSSITAKLGDMNLDQLNDLLDRENIGKTRSTLVSAITEAMNDAMKNDEGDEDE